MRHSLYRGPLSRVSEGMRGCLTLPPRFARREWPYDSPSPPSDVFERGFKGHRADREADARAAKVAAGLARQPDLAAARAKARAPKAGPETAYDDAVLTTREKRIRARGVLATRTAK